MAMRTLIAGMGPDADSAYADWQEYSTRAPAEYRISRWDGAGDIAPGNAEYDFIDIYPAGKREGEDLLKRLPQKEGLFPPPALGVGPELRSSVWGHRTFFLRNSIIYHPVCLELKKCIVEQRFGAISEFHIYSAGREGTETAESIFVLYWFIGPWHEWGIDESKENRVQMSVSRKGVGAELYLGEDSVKSPQTRLRLQALFTAGTVEGSIGGKPVMTYHPYDDEPYQIVLPEGDGLFYWKKDVEESLHEDRESYILPVDTAMNGYGLAEKIAEDIEDEARGFF